MPQCRARTADFDTERKKAGLCMPAKAWFCSRQWTADGRTGAVSGRIVILNGAPRAGKSSIAACMQEPQIRQRNDQLGVESLGTTPEELATVLRDEAIKWREVITRAGIRLE